MLRKSSNIAYSNFLNSPGPGSGGRGQGRDVPLGYVADIGTSDMFQSYKEDFLRLEGQIDLRVSQASSSRDPESNDAGAIQNMLKEADAAVKQMEYEAKTLPNRNQLMSQVTDYRNRLGSMRRRCQGITSGEGMRDALLGTFFLHVWTSSFNQFSMNHLGHVFFRYSK